MSVLFKIILVLAFFYYLFKFLIIYILPKVINRIFEKSYNSYYDSPERPQKNEGEITIITKEETKSKNKNKDGEYIDYEEI
jgi:hypothetical protein